MGCTAEAVESPGPEVSTTMVSPSVAPSVRESPRVSPTPSASPSPTAFESYPGGLPTEDPETAAIIAGWQEYQRVYEKYAMAPYDHGDLTETQTVTTGHEATVILDRLDALREQDLEYVGGRKFRKVSVQLTEENSEGLLTSSVGYCLDMEDVTLRVATTGEIIERTGTYREMAHLVRGRDDVWRVESIQSSEEPC
ncbi:hypothetical protein GCM10025789_09000 [Tessaracoccus lubricantis]|uniref:SnoaL-like domain-containing protein n=2 Tax=Tessaracoccus lubricantis TaxID=545543 RepID=A0ABP9F6B6_9ACTN